ncbi:ABC transporter permease [Kitasatospora sp. RG8]|uniref:ABC transporter permease n=1 Tax=Kitasatospora sp. RG8 TaxID=2820815 RepID=UPI001ADF726A|nr:ABC transporter permease [Kitasatospora sp. RG8]MBP0452796.1 ABC transporter permease [Kitasatospora sp. RG8]
MTALAPEPAGVSPASSFPSSPSFSSSAAAGRTAEPPARFGDVFAAEWIKLRSLRSTPWILAFTVLFVVGSSAAAALAESANLAGVEMAARPNEGFLVFDAYPVPGYLTLMLVAGSLGTFSVVNEYGSGLIRTTMVAVPARREVVLAKAAVVTAVWTVAGTVTSIGSFTVSQAILNGHQAGVPISHPGVLRAVVVSALVAPVCALVGLCFGVLVRHGAAATVTTGFVLLMLPVFFSTSVRWSADVNHLMVSSAWKRLVQHWSPPPGSGFDYPTVSGSWAVLAVWPLAAVVLSLVVVRRRDV